MIKEFVKGRYYRYIGDKNNSDASEFLLDGLPKLAFDSNQLLCKTLKGEFARVYVCESSFSDFEELIKLNSHEERKIGDLVLIDNKFVPYSSLYEIIDINYDVIRFTLKDINLITLPSIEVGCDLLIEENIFRRSDQCNDEDEKDNFLKNFGIGSNSIFNINNSLKEDNNMTVRTSVCKVYVWDKVDGKLVVDGRTMIEKNDTGLVESKLRDEVISELVRSSKDRKISDFVFDFTIVLSYDEVVEDKE
jgi:hypothetical protein